MKPVLIIKAGSTHDEIASYYGDFEDWIGQRLSAAQTVQVQDARQCDQYPPPSSLAGVVISGSHAMLTEQQPWMLHLEAWLQTVVHQFGQLPVLGICFGHQLLAHSLGGTVADNPMGSEAGTVALRLNAQGQRDPLLSALRSHPWVQVAHRQSVLQPPAEATILASNAHDACQAFRYGERVWGLQFHPEFSADVMRAYLQANRGESLTEQAVEQALPQVRECEDAGEILSRFARLAARQAA